ncbi:unnamed protein product [marine sediment metagenome]|uniref:Uncharacterized protein n=1 Tax=marine sediment metagenome TaxID=412755 RepID=X0T0G8_9ZZZZ
MLLNSSTLAIPAFCKAFLARWEISKSLIVVIAKAILSQLSTKSQITKIEARSLKDTKFQIAQITQTNDKCPMPN